jgi:hypothetical protein
MCGALLAGRAARRAAAVSAGTRSRGDESEDHTGARLALVVTEGNGRRSHGRKPCHRRLLGLPLTRRHHGLLIFAHPAAGRSGHRAAGK